MTAGRLKEWLNGLSSGQDLALPDGLPDELEGLGNAVNINALADWFTVGVGLTDVDPDAGNLCLGGTIDAATPAIALWFFTADDSESVADDAEIIGVQIALSLKDHPVMSVLGGIGLRDLLLVYEIRMLDGAAIRELYAQADLPAQDGETLLVTCALDFAAGQQSFEFIVELESGKEWHVAEAFFALFGVAPPQFLRDIALERLTLAYDGGTGTTGFRVNVNTRFPLGDTTADLDVEATLTKQSDGQGYDQEYAGRLLLEVPAQGGDDDESARLGFLGQIVRTSAGAWELSASLENRGEALTLADLAAAVGIDVPPDLEPLVPALHAASFTYRFPAGPSTPGSLVVSAAVGRVGVVVASVPTGAAGSAVARLVAVRGAVGARASDLPLVGESIPAGRDVVVTGAHFLYADAPLPLDRVRELNSVVAGMPGADEGLLPTLPEEALQRGPMIWATPTIGDEVLPPLVLRPNTGPALALSLAAARDPAPADVVEGAVVLGRERGDATHEMDLLFGPVRIRRISLGYARGRLFVAFGAMFPLGPVQLDMIGLGLAVGQDFTVTQVLQGSGVRVEAPPLKVTGALEVRDDDKFAVYIAGLVTVEAGFFAMQAAGSYARSVDGWSSVFLFGEIAAVGGAALFVAPPFTVTAVSAGFGVNSTLRIPAIEELGEFPLVANLASGGSGDSPQEALEALADWVRPAEGRYWAAAGLEFTLFKFIATRALAVAEFGDDLKLALLGRTSVTFPRDTKPGKKVHARLDIDLKLAYQQSQGLFSLDAAVGAGSFVFDPACRLTGGIAVYLWTAGRHAGDFVITAGGYHPTFEKNLPAHYPRPARLGFIWSPDSKIMVKAEGYTALTPHAFMVGGRLAATYTSGLLSAWFTAYLDVLIQWRPFYLEANLGIGIGVAFTIKVLFVKVRVSIEVGIDLALWTPPFGGRATVKVWFVSFSFDIGSKRVELDDATWPEVHEQLPEPLSITPVAGLLADVDAGELAARRADGDPVLVAAAGLVFTVETVIPATAIHLNQDTDYATAPHGGISIRPMHKDRSIASEFVVTVVKVGDADYVISEDDWSVEVIERGAPAALWGRPLAKPDDALDERQEALLPGQLAGLRFEVKLPETAGEIGPVTSAALAVTPVLPAGHTPLRNGGKQGPVPLTDPRNSVDTIAEGIDSTTKARRAGAYRALHRLGLAPGACGASLPRYASKAPDYLVSSPLTTTAR
ncbi:DUF6603 domain-containing protein [Streptomyces sp. TRM49041]|uniref:DUF6603 domain-containing protein n=1 Tax=Streptomyces sp. TRM49041 TaxID=2603216 RepID=UPI00292A4291|nr:DUF6603 domain-containing protein [Streptomyces sp. TRM49041]